MKKIKKVQACGAKVLPTVYSEALSYYEEVCKIAKKMEELIISMGGKQDAIADLNEIREGAAKGAEALPIARDAQINANGALQAVALLNTQVLRKQDIIGDLATIRANAAKGATAVQPSELAAYIPKEGNGFDVVHEGDMGFYSDTPEGESRSTLWITMTGAGMEYEGNMIHVDEDGAHVNNKDIATEPTVFNLTTEAGAVELEDNCEYYFTPNESADTNDLNFSYPSGKFHCFIKITCGATGDIEFPTSEYIDEPPSLEAGETWELDIKDGVIASGKVER